MVPELVGKLTGLGCTLAVQPGAGVGALYSDEDYLAAGAEVADDALEGADLVVSVNPLDDAEVRRLPAGTSVMSFLPTNQRPDLVVDLRDLGITSFAMELVPRISRAQSMDALSSQALVSGYRCAIVAAGLLRRFFPLNMTAAGTVPPAEVVVLGAGVAGLQAIATARRLGAVVSGFDVRPVVKEQVESLGATFLELSVRGEETEGGYAKELTPEQQAQQQEELAERISGFDAVITTALIPGRAAPLLIPASAVEAMRPGSVIVDLAAEAGGNCELTTPGRITAEHDVTIVGLTNLPSTMPYHASQLYSRNVTALLQLLVDDGELKLDWSDEIIAGACVAGKQEVAA